MIEKVPELLFDILTLVIISFIVVLIYFGLRSETVISTADTVATDEFITDAKRNGYITKDDYENYIDRLAMTKVIYDIALEHTYTLLEPEYRMRTIQEIIDAQKAAYTGSNIYTYVPVSTEAPAVYDPISTGTLNTETNASVLASAENTAASSSHIHTEACYCGHRHTGTTGEFTYSHMHSWNCYSYMKSHGVYSTCVYCGHKFYSLWVDYYWDPTTNSAKVAGTPYASGTCTSCGRTNAATNDINQVNYGYSCGFDKDMDGDGLTDNTVGTATAYTYVTSSPHVESFSYPWGSVLMQGSTNTTVTNGCYKYHKHGYLAGYPVSATNNNDTKSRIAANPVAMIAKYGANSFCYLPSQYAVYYVNSTGHMQGPITYIATKQDDGPIIMTKGPIRIEGSYVQDTYPFPATMTLDEFATIMSSFTNFKAWVFTYFPTSTLQYTTDSDYDMYYWLYGGINNCGYTNADTWYPGCGQAEDASIDCGKIILSIVPTHPTQTVSLNDPLITTVKVNYLDGSVVTREGTTTFSTSAICQNKPVEISYQYTIDGVQYSKTCTITVTVILRTKTCVNGHTYNLNTDGTDPGCPYCKAWVKRIQLVNPSSNEFTIDIGTTLEENGITLLVTYQDGHTETISSGYIDNLDSNYLGTMQVTIGYKGATMMCRVTTVCKRTTCSICGYVYELWPDGFDPGCPRCISKIPVFTGNVLEHTKHEDMEDILDKLYQKGIYRFNVNDIFSIKLKNKSRSAFRNLLKKFFPSLSDIWVSLDKSVKIWRQ